LCTEEILKVIGSLTLHQSTIQRLAADKEIYRIGIMKITKNIGMLLLAVYLIVDGLLGFGLNLGPAIFLLYLLAIIAGFLILLGK
jgi:NAD(P)H-hydrate repair Nnr-like enzyme with NAD(P)H-hydrate epimerase domain